MEQNKNLFIIGGVPRKVKQVKITKKYKKIKDDMDVGTILNVSRADRLLKKESQKYITGVINDLALQTSKNKFIELPNIDWKSESFKDTHNAYKTAKKIEKYYAEQASYISSS